MLDKTASKEAIIEITVADLAVWSIPEDYVIDIPNDIDIGINDKEVLCCIKK